MRRLATGVAHHTRRALPALVAAPAADEDALVPPPRWAVADAPFWRRYRWVLGLTALAHLGSGVAMAVLLVGSDWPTRLCAGYSTWTCATPGKPPCTRTAAWRYVGDVSPAGMITSFFFLSAAFQAPPVVFYGWYRRCLLEGRQPLRFLEYSVSSTMMVLTIALLVGVFDLWTFLLLAGANWSVMMFGLLQEQTVYMLRSLMHGGGSDAFRPMSLRAGNWAAYMAPHLCGWVPFALEWAVLTGKFEWSLASMDGVPAVVKAIPVVQLALFAVFGVNQYYGAADALHDHSGDKEGAWRWTYMHSEVAYTALSLVAKTLLGWMVYGGTRAQDPKMMVVAALC